MTLGGLLFSEEKGQGRMYGPKGKGSWGEGKLQSGCNV